MSNAQAKAFASNAVATAEAAASASALALHAVKEVHACAAAADAAAAAALSASEGEDLLPATPPVTPPSPVAVRGWDAAGFGPALVVGSLSTHPPEMTAGGESSLDAKWPTPDVEINHYKEAVRAHSLSGVDMLWLEMMKEEEHAPRAVRAAAAAGLPVFLGISARTDQATGKPVMWGTGVDAVPLDPDWFHKLAGILGTSLVGVNVMHTNFSTMAAALKFVREDCGWHGPLGAYPDHGRFEAPDWIFEEIDNADSMKHVEKWIKEFDVQLLGGCCGLGPEYITALSAFTRSYNAQVRQKSE
jgi:S-methylmethionine-dependent homocysteine/selenocysteine methylase